MYHVLENIHQNPVRIPIHDFKHSRSNENINDSMSYYPSEYLWKCGNLLEF